MEKIAQLRAIFWLKNCWGCCIELGAGWNELGGVGWSWVEVDGGGWSWVEVGALFSNTLLVVMLWIDHNFFVLSYVQIFVFILFLLTILALADVFSFRNVELSSIHSSVTASYSISPTPLQRDEKNFNFYKIYFSYKKEHIHLHVTS